LENGHMFSPLKFFCLPGSSGTRQPTPDVERRSRRRGAVN
jgi:hypothetical protein